MALCELTERDDVEIEAVPLESVCAVPMSVVPS